MNALGEENNNKSLTLGELYLLIEEMMEKDESVANLPVMLVENIMRRGAIEPTVRHMDKDDITIEKDLHLSCNTVYSLFDKGVVIGFLTSIQE